MSEQKQQAKVNLIAIFTITLATWLILVPFVNSIKIPLGENTKGVISLASIENISPYTDYLKYIILLLTPPLIATLVLNLNQKPLRIILRVINHRYIWIGISSILLLTWLINTPFNQFRINSTLIDSFHEGEFLGFLPNFLQLKQPFINTVLIHGYGVDVLPSWLAKNLATQNHGIALTRLFVNLENVITCVGYFWILWELINLAEINKNKLKIFLISCIIFCVFDGIFYKFDGRRGTSFIIQLALTLRFFRIAKTQPKQAQWLSVLIGASIPSSFFYIYDRAIYFIAVYLCASILSLFLDKKTTIIWLRGTLIGIISVTIISIIFLGFEQINAIISQVLYWGKYGRYISFIPLPPLELSSTSQTFWLSMFFQSGVLVYLILDFKNQELKLRPFVQKNTLIILLLIPASVYMRITLDRSDIGHAYHGALITTFLVIYLIYLVYKHEIEPQLSQLNITPIQQSLTVLLLIVIILSEPGFNLVRGMEKITQLPDALSTPNQELLKPDYLEAWNTLKPEIEQQSCFFTLTSEGLWYYLFDKPSCSKYSYVLYAKPTVAQQEVIQELNETKPDILLLTNEMWYQNPWDEILKSESASLIYQNVLTTYRPYKTVQSHWFWKRNNQPLKLTKTQSLNGNIESLPTQPIHQRDNLSIGGWSILPESSQPADAVYLSLGKKNQLITVGQVNIPRPDVVQVLSNPKYEKSGWIIRVPTAILPQGNNQMKVWSYDSKKNQLTQIGKGFNLEILS
ncbi:hypothetical protein PCC7805_00932 [Planktothrix agardhii]|jgi:hypothetical protein|uniref:Glycosyltransferase RgtA/B/C/D-like domain-containing protein n=1 Tax=Planktothrix agardhii TaxID=1160 RepID=A0A1J1JM77_PLAAG|nr:hypothetical protein [Planktothrix agardhii]MBG0747462.1 hypothetical protein [Planktothrix agardhii KL2]MCB8788456.1 hypothetical protein [Planktothrix agardhii 1025]MCF3582635.1 hypothetical protein [Planktothrix agardhii 1811]MCF3612577.1 hypothetical protein [Planktothrix agardhii 1027]MCF3624150.1 hypothetical protein [Planktothrix agardhii 1801]